MMWVFYLSSSYCSWVLMLFIIIMISGVLLMLFFITMLTSNLFKLKKTHISFFIMFLLPNLYFFKNYFFSEMSLNLMELTSNNLSLIMLSLFLFIVLMLLTSIITISSKFYRQVLFLNSGYHS
uniref:NADH dehydrogenase subunit 6 n=1 Tax=Romanomermis iyengari TaxID=416168 RepID=A1Z3A7_ROMIY|nr:NADH dehydrogenase subunit 6 [Romanomermis iyengari]ABL73790.1 NADH dehydrogenase subunit 6 [Romanomermis iyengari]